MFGIELFDERVEAFKFFLFFHRQFFWCRKLGGWFDFARDGLFFFWRPLFLHGLLTAVELVIVAAGML